MNKVVKEEKDRLHQAVALLKQRGVIKREQEIAEATGYNKATFSGMKSYETEKRVSFKFQKKFEAVYGIDISSPDTHIETEHSTRRRLLKMEATSEVLLEYVLQILTNTTWKKASMLKIEMESAIESRTHQLERELHPLSEVNKKVNKTAFKKKIPPKKTKRTSVLQKH